MIIGLNGKMGVGKTTGVKYIQERLGDVKLVKFAQPLYDTQEFIYDQISSVYKRPETFVKDRKLLQWIGTEWGRDTISQTLWVDLWAMKAEEYARQGLHVVCDDVRFDNEAETIRSLGGIVVQITSGQVAQRDVVTNGIQSHASEKGIDESLINYRIVNDKSLQDYNDAICAMLDDAGVTAE